MWFEKEGLLFWCEFLSNIGISFSTDSKKTLCVKHYRHLRRQISERHCVNCGKGNDENNWIFISSLKRNNPSFFSVLENLIDNSVSLNLNDMLCNACEHLLCKEANIEAVINRVRDKRDPITQCRFTVLENMLDSIKSDGVVLSTAYVDTFKEKIVKHCISNNEHDPSKIIRNFKAFVDRVMKAKNYDSYFDSCGKPGKLTLNYFHLHVLKSYIQC